MQSKVKNIAYILSMAAAAATLVIGFDSMSEPYSFSGAAFILWAISPYGFLSILIKAAKSKAAEFGVILLCLIVSIFGLVLIIDAMYIHLHAQSGLIFIFAPLWQWVGLLLFSLLLLFLNKVKET
jgi:hypothetical protein